MSDQGWIGVDLDGTLAHYDFWRGEDHIGEPIPAMLARVKQWLSEGRDVRLVTARCYSPQMVDNGFHIASMFRIQALNTIREWCIKHVGQELPIQCWKDFGMVELWDDRAVQVIPNRGIRIDGNP
jgi:hypothetical protein